MSEKLSERTLPILVLPAGRYGMLGGGGTGLLNGAVSPGATALLAGETGSLGNVVPLGNPIDTIGYDRAMILANTKGQTGTAQTLTITAYHGAVPSYGDAGTTAVAGFSFDAAGVLPMLAKGELRLNKLQRYLWINTAFVGPGETDASVVVILGEPDKTVSGQTLLDEGP